ncbi:tRNA (adenosine(37)-N6)-dimethylallyltransferase MiaA [bacterium]|nr:tRNA (adenosine(37)-N6)-dimethylallyltransferase MiaA [bacterium]
MQKLVVILGPTASGKTSLGIFLAQKFNGEIISADSRQVYKDLDIGTAKVENTKPKNRNRFQREMGYCLAEGVPHWLIDVADIKKDLFSAGQFSKMADKIIKDISRRGKIPFLVGGSMLYIDAVTRGLKFAPPIDSKIRKKLSTKKLVELQNMLKKLDSKAYKVIDINNPRRLERALEVKLSTGKSIVDFWKKRKRFNTLKLGIKMPRKLLYQRIDLRVDERMQEGMLDEVKQLLKQGVPKEKLISLGLEYRYLTLTLLGEMPLKEAVALLKGAIHRFARRQLSWWRRDKEIIWLNYSNLEQEAEKQLSSFLKKQTF